MRFPGKYFYGQQDNQKEKYNHVHCLNELSQ